VNNCLECPFHGWQYDGKGQCVKIPYEENIPSNAKVKSWTVLEQNGIICMFFDAEEREPSWYPPAIPGIEDGSGQFVFRGHVRNRISAHIQELPENGPDIMHLSHLHLHFPWKFFGNLWRGTWSVDKNIAHIAHLDVEQITTFLNYNVPGSTVTTKVHQIGPAIVYLNIQLPFGKVILQETTTPISPMLQQLDLTIYAQWYIPTFVIKIIMWVFLLQFDTDFPVWNNKTFASKPLVVKKESPIVQYRRWYSQFYSEHSPKLTSTEKVSLEW